ncbi:hypothetical protein B0J12DRAFT_221592 [Macrophomina phaseolina]|uniref:Uncharacterized protein n=1 Tax=Macrophomina phaseolina TaxID=35725 RepID=A0ABQ8G0M8_9PEZI|nr:hypothetical protein B0J12DRAFT_221592 [Macrophomina phaseolina]
MQPAHGAHHGCVSYPLSPAASTSPSYALVLSTRASARIPNFSPPPSPSELPELLRRPNESTWPRPPRHCLQLWPANRVAALIVTHRLFPLAADAPKPSRTLSGATAPRDSCHRPRCAPLARALCGPQPFCILQPASRGEGRSGDGTHSAPSLRFSLHEVVRASSCILPFLRRSHSGCQSGFAGRKKLLASPAVTLTAHRTPPSRRGKPGAAVCFHASSPQCNIARSVQTLQPLSAESSLPFV